ncbi:MAG TPA: glycosyltransferase family 1 protein [Longimicrobium sp.]|jgi:glycosyltransferase involved in cell wall biosynthesis|nr:glycosyltransferase family 1 protein [Longimicrobium sp.]
MRVLYDISMLGLGHLYSLSRGGSHRADRHLAEGLMASGEVELLLCANHSSAAYLGCLEYLRTGPPLADVALLGPGEEGAASAFRRGAAGAHGWARRILGSNVLPGLLRRGAKLVDRRIHPTVCDASPPVDVFHSPGVPLPARRGRSPRRFATIYDLAYLRFPEIYGAAYLRTARAAMESLGEGDSVLTSSESSRAELCERGVAAPDRVFVAPLGADPRTFHPCADPDRLRAVRDRYGIPEGPYILSVNTPDPRKNVRHAIRAFARVAGEAGARDLTLVLAGHGGPGSHPDPAEEGDGLRGRIVRTGYVDDAELAPLYSGAAAFVYPSLYEGFGLTPLEAMQCGTPVIASNTSSFPEVVGDAGILLDPADGDALCQAILDVHRDTALRERMREQSLARAARFSWERCTRATLDAYRAALAG